MYWRSVLFVPANDSRKAEKALQSEADAVAIDLEDAVAYAEKDNARRQMQALLATPPPRPVVVRVNACHTRWILADLEAVVGLPVAGIMVAKIESGEEVRRLDWLLGLLEERHGISTGTIPLIPFLETATAILRAVEIATASPRIRCLAFGGNDYTMELGMNYSHSGEELYFARQMLVHASRMAGIEPPLDSVNPNLTDSEFLYEDARRARALGFQGKLVIHPRQVTVVNEVFSPSAEEVAWAEKIIAAFKAAEAAGTAVIQVNGRMIEYPMVRRAEKILQIYHHHLKK